MFTTPCFIHKVSEELISRLEELGYHKFESSRGIPEGDDILSVIELENNEPVYAYVSYENIRHMDDYIDCGTNEELFLAIAALRNDSDIHQWFIHEDKSIDWWVKCMDDKKEYDEIMWYDCVFNEFNKATVEELIDHFKDE